MIMKFESMNKMLKRTLSIGFHEVKDDNIHGSRQFISDDKKICLLITNYSYTFIFRTIHGLGRISVTSLDFNNMDDVVEYYKRVLFDLDYRNCLESLDKLETAMYSWINWNGEPLGENK